MRAMPQQERDGPSVPPIQGDELRVSGKKRDDLQAAMAGIRALKLEHPIQFMNFRD